MEEELLREQMECYDIHTRILGTSPFPLPLPPSFRPFSHSPALPCSLPSLPHPRSLFHIPSSLFPSHPARSWPPPPHPAHPTSPDRTHVTSRSLPPAKPLPHLLQTSYFTSIFSLHSCSVIFITTRHCGEQVCGAETREVGRERDRLQNENYVN
ncbi:hypothetical protein E2C01_031046 [Portunus trituberculatus]|uniref:Uncharacterized protein n=1 Tax=Portunus trituberculatus TaxID=210409 RepID=A0A5B7ES14_PORTR|nr:hypothetical protein [Portunus trituberculatus]